ncbi:Putative cysteine-rich receptor-like protein kinase 20 [Triticum urartu]|uniref:non-specific serine/threonine protein kinase n=1 Tax=Triticum urartu TaxID=4572 RepID=M7ZUM4_TRIUA|nr:Putative cysteine-rich receptor-like protein kinase 20 [Triticum urartu]
MAGVLLLLLLLMPASASAIGIVCGSGGNYTANSTYHSNLAVLNATLPANTSSSPQLFLTATANATANSTAGVLLGQTAQYAAAAARRVATGFMDSIGPGTTTTLYSLAQCTPDLSAGDCLACLQRLVGSINATNSVRLGGRIFRLRCNVRFEAFMFFDDKNIRPIPSPSSLAQAPATAPAPAGKRHGVKPWVIALSVAASVALVALCFIVCCLRRLRTKNTKGKGALRGKRAHEFQEGDEVWEMEAELSEFAVFDFNQILEATGNFSEENKLGEGGFGPVYKGLFPDGVEIAVKRLDADSGQGFIEFKNEVELIAKLQHRNLVRLMGCCSQGEEKILVYEYLPNKSLDFFIFDEDRKALLDWDKRITIIVGTAEGLLYLHKHSRLRVIHRDLKPSNILLDSEMNAKISDFGLAKIFSSNNADTNTTRKVVGTYGYMAPEYASHGIFSIKSDVFSFGVLTLEIVSGKRNSHECGAFINLLGHAWQLFQEESWSELIDAALVPNIHSTEMMRCINIALLCVQENAVDRPTMLDVIAMLSNKTMILQKPKHPAYFSLSTAGNKEAPTTTKSCSVNDVTISTVGVLEKSVKSLPEIFTVLKFICFNHRWLQRQEYCTEQKAGACTSTTSALCENRVRKRSTSSTSSARTYPVQPRDWCSECFDRFCAIGWKTDGTDLSREGVLMNIIYISHRLKTENVYELLGSRQRKHLKSGRIDSFFRDALTIIVNPGICSMVVLWKRMTFPRYDYLYDRIKSRFCMSIYNSYVVSYSLEKLHQGFKM